jgi:predicted AAA+ superfamily ATPase
MESSWWKDISQLDEEQKKVISLDDDADHLVIGPPGCGKTNLLLLRASYLHKRGLPISKCSPLAEFLRNSLRPVPRTTRLPLTKCKRLCDGHTRF